MESRIILKCVLLNGLFACGADCYVSVPGRMAGRRSRSEEASVSLRSRAVNTLISGYKNQSVNDI